MDRYLLNDILEGRDYSIWRDKINEVNKEYHDKVYYGKNGPYDYAIRCRQRLDALWNWRNYKKGTWGGIYHVSFVYFNRYCYEDRILDIKLHKNY